MYHTLIFFILRQIENPFSREKGGGGGKGEDHSPIIDTACNVERYLVMVSSRGSIAIMHILASGDVQRAAWESPQKGIPDAGN